MLNENKEYETKICKKCGRLLPVEKFRLVRGKFHNPYYLGHCKECEYKYQRKYLEKENQIKFSDNLEILIPREYKTIKAERILDVTDVGIELKGADEIFVKLMDYKDAWLSNYGRLIRYSNNEYVLVKGSYDNYGSLKYTVSKDAYVNGKWKYIRKCLYAAKAVLEEFIINPDKKNNIYIWHKGFDKQD